MPSRAYLAVSLLAAALLLSTASNTTAAEPPELALWPDAPPGLPAGEKLQIVAKEDPRIGSRITKVTRPTLTLYKPDAASDTGAAVVICPGGGYNILAAHHEGVEVAQWLNKLGVTGILLKYRVPRAKDQPKHYHPLQDAQRAIRLARQNAESWKIDPERLGILGFSAGGHLAAAASTNFDRSAYEAVDEADKLDVRPDFAILIYPAYLTTENDGLELAEEIRVTERTPPTFLVHTGDDRISAAGSIAFYLALRKNGVPGELHVFPTGGHGYGLRPSDHAVSHWPQLAERWLTAGGFLEK